MRRKTFFLAAALALALSLSMTMADYSSQGNITIPGASATGRNVVSSDMHTSYATTSGSTNTYVSVTATFSFFTSGGNFGSETVNGSASVYIRKEPVNAPSGCFFYNVSSTHTASYNGNSGSVNLNTNVP